MRSETEGDVLQSRGADVMPMEILLVEDNKDDVELALRSFEKARISNHVQVVNNGAEALDYIFGKGRYADRDKHDRPKVILLDLKLPLVSGLEVLRRVKSDPDTRSIPVVILTSSRESPDVVESYELGANSYIVKPVDFRQFSEAARRLGLYWMLLNEPLSDA